MRIVALSLGLAFMAAAAGANLWVGKPARGGWFATNQDAFCSLKRIVETSDAKLEFLFVSGLPHGDVSRRITFQVNATPAQLVWPVRLSVGSDPTAPHVEIGADASSPTSLSGADVDRLLTYLKDGKGLDVQYSLSDGIERRVYLDAYNFFQSVAMFEACAVHVA